MILAGSIYFQVKLDKPYDISKVTKVFNLPLKENSNIVIGNLLLDKKKVTEVKENGASSDMEHQNETSEVRSERTNDEKFDMNKLELENDNLEVEELEEGNKL